MFPKTLLLLSSTLFISLVAASTAPSCIKNETLTSVYTTANVASSYNSFCTQLADNHFPDAVLAGVITFQYVRGSSDSCINNMTAADCNSAYEKLFSGCSPDNSNINGAGVLVTTCGAYNFNVTQGNSTGSASPTGSGSGSSPTGSNTGTNMAGRTNGINLCIGTGSLLVGVGAIFGWFL
ncbi:hypothetical protein ACMFMG_002812 [Clarireedia jacksonii]